MSKNRQKPGAPRRPAYIPSVQQTVAGPGPTVDALGKSWRLAFNTQNAKAALEELIRAFVVRRELPTKRALGGEEGERYWREEVKPLLDSGYYDTFGPGWLSTLRSGDGVILFLQSLLLKHHPEVTTAEVKEIFATEPEQVMAAVEVVAPDFFASAAVQVGYSTADAKTAAPELANALRERFASARQSMAGAMEKMPEPATVST